MNEMNSLVSIIVRTKDRTELLKRALQSIASQTYRPIEVVLVNDGGCDLNTEESKAVLGDVLLNYIRLEKNTGRAHAGNVGIENAKGEYIGFLDDDDEFYPDHVQILAHTLIYNPLQIAYSDAEMVLMESDSLDNFVEKFSYPMFSQDFSADILRIQNYIPFMCLLFDRNVFRDAQFDKSYNLFEDWNLLINLSDKYWFQHVKKVTARYIQWSDEFQINRRALAEDFSQEAYKRILTQNFNKIKPVDIYSYCVYSASEKSQILSELKAARMGLQILSELKTAKMDLQKAESDLQKLEKDNETLIYEITCLSNHLAHIKEGLAWKLIERYRAIKEKTVPTGTTRRFFYDFLLKSCNILRNEGINGLIIRARKRVRYKWSYIRSNLKLRKIRPIVFYSDDKIIEKYKCTRRPVSIIMPVFNGFDCLCDCVESILRNTDLSVHRLIVIDDKSTEHIVAGYLRKLSENRGGKNIQVLFNNDNMGFVKTVNRGMKMTDDDVVIINSDIIATKNWLEKLQRAAYSKPKVATATPLSNYVTINGIPQPFRFNSIPQGLDVHSFAEFIEKISLYYYPEIPAGVGFCLYIKRKILDEIGFFDEVRFEKGYAEETDFCMRALKKGYKHVLDDSTYIYHIGGVSFESIKDPEVLREKNLMIGRNLDVLRTLHPEYTSLVDKALSQDLKPVHDYINLRINLMDKDR